MAKAHKLGLFTATGAGTGAAFSGDTHGGSFIVGTNTAGSAATVTLEGSPNKIDWYSVLTLAGTPAAVSLAVASTECKTLIVGGSHPYLRANCTNFTAGNAVPAWFAPRGPGK